MNILVLLKQVPNPDLQFRLDDRGTDIRRENLTYQLGGADEHALEEAVRLKERRGGRVTAISLGPERCVEVLRAALAKGADGALRVADDDPWAFDPGRNARILAAVARKVGFDLILTGVQSGDYAHGATGGLLAGLLGIPSAAVVTKVEVVDGGALRVERELEGGVREVDLLPLPALLTVQFGINEPRYASVAAILRASRTPIPVLGPRDLGLGSWAEAAPPYRAAIRRLLPPPARGRAEMIEGSPEEAAKRLAQILRQRGVVRGG